MTITWRNVGVQDASGAGSLLRTGLQAINTGFDQLGNAVQGVGNVVQERETTALNNKIDAELAALRESQNAARDNFAETATKLNELPGIKTVDLQGGITKDTFKTADEIFADMGVDPKNASAAEKSAVATMMQEAQDAIQRLDASNIMDDEEYIRRAAGIYSQDPTKRDADTQALGKDFFSKSFSNKPVNDRVIALNEQRIDAAIAGKDAQFTEENERFDFMTNEQFTDVLTARDTYGKISDPKSLVDKALRVNIDKETGKPTNFSAGDLETVQGLTNFIKKDLENAKPSDLPRIDIPKEIRDANRNFTVTPAALGYALERIPIDQEFFESIDSNDLENTDEEVLDNVRQEVINFLIREESYRNRRQEASQNRSAQLEELRQDQLKALDAKAKLGPQAKTAAGQINFDAFR